MLISYTDRYKYSRLNTTRKEIEKMAQKAKKTESAGQIQDKEAKKKALQTALSQITKDHGVGSIMKLGENTNMNVTAVSTGSLSLDLALGVGGVPRGRIIEIYGPEASGKTTLALHVVSEVQKTGGIAAYIDVENALDPQYAAAIGVDVDELLVSQPESGEAALGILDALVRSGAVDVVVVDSVAALVTQQEIDGDIGDAQVAGQARLMSQALRKLSGSIAKSNCVVIFINQLRMKIGVMYGNPEVTSGGTALKYYASVRIDIRRIETLKNGSESYGNRVKCKIVKNKVAPPFKTAEFDILYGKGISKSSELIEVGVEMGIIEKSGAWFYIDGNRLAQGRDNARQALEDNPELFKMIEDRIIEKFKNGDSVQSENIDLDEDFNISVADLENE